MKKNGNFKFDQIKTPISGFLKKRIILKLSVVAFIIYI